MTGRSRLTPNYTVLCPQGLGDSLQATPLIAGLRASAPCVRITVVVLRHASKLLFGSMPDLVDCVEYLPYWEKGQLAFALRSLYLPSMPTADASFLTFPASRIEYAVLHALIPSKKRITHDYPKLRTLVRFIRNVHSVELTRKPNTLRNFDLLSAAGITVPAPAHYVVPASWRSAEPPTSKIIVHVGSINHDGFDRKRWPETSFIELIQRLTRRGYDVTLLNGPEEREATQRIRNAVPGTELFEGSLPEIAREISLSATLVANDNGIAHLAAGVGTPVVALFGPTPVEHGPYGTGVTVVRPSACPPCFSPLETGIYCKRDIDYRCLKLDLTVDIAEAAVIKSAHSPAALRVSSAEG